MTLYAVMFTETDGYEYSVDICLGVYDSEEKAETKITKEVERSMETFKERKSPPEYFGCYRKEYYILEHNLNEDW
jgi:hypothetical protein